MSRPLDDKNTIDGIVTSYEYNVSKSALADWAETSLYQINNTLLGRVRFTTLLDDSEKEELLEDYNCTSSNKLTMEAIARKHNISKSHVYSILHELANRENEMGSKIYEVNWGRKNNNQNNIEQQPVSGAGEVYRVNFNPVRSTTLAATGTEGRSSGHFPYLGSRAPEIHNEENAGAEQPRTPPDDSQLPREARPSVAPTAGAELPVVEATQLPPSPATPASPLTPSHSRIGEDQAISFSALEAIIKKYTNAERYSADIAQDIENMLGGLKRLYPDGTTPSTNTLVNAWEDTYLNNYPNEVYKRKENPPKKKRSRVILGAIASALLIGAIAVRGTYDYLNHYSIRPLEQQVLNQDKKISDIRYEVMLAEAERKRKEAEWISKVDRDVAGSNYEVLREQQRQQAEAANRLNPLLNRLEKILTEKQSQPIPVSGTPDKEKIVGLSKVEPKPTPVVEAPKPTEEPLIILNIKPEMSRKETIKEYVRFFEERRPEVILQPDRIGEQVGALLDSDKDGQIALPVESKKR